MSPPSRLKNKSQLVICLLWMVTTTQHHWVIGWVMWWEGSGPSVSVCLENTVLFKALWVKRLHFYTFNMAAVRIEYVAGATTAEMMIKSVIKCRKPTGLQLFTGRTVHWLGLQLIFRVRVHSRSFILSSSQWQRWGTNAFGASQRTMEGVQKHGGGCERRGCGGGHSEHVSAGTVRSITKTQLGFHPCHPFFPLTM